MYVRDVAGQITSIYQKSGTDYNQIEIPFYGNSRLGTKKNEEYVYELKDHLGNVRQTIKTIGGNTPDEASSDWAYSKSEYYPFGMKFMNVNSYRYGYQGEYAEDETGEDGIKANSFQLRLYNPRLGRWLSPNPKGQYHSPYLAMGNNPTNSVDPDGGETIYKNASTGETVEVKDDVDKTIVVNDHQFELAKFFASDITPGFKREHLFGYSRRPSFSQKSIKDAYVDFYNSVNYYESYSLSNLYDLFYNGPNVTYDFESIGGAGALEIVDGVKGHQLLYGVMKKFGYVIKIQKHHIIPKAVYKRFGKTLEAVMELNGGNNLKKLPTPFHGNHPQYNKYVGNRITELGERNLINSKNIDALQKDLNRLINKAYDSGIRLNEYFRGLN